MISRLLIKAIHAPIGYLYMRLRYGKYHKRKLIERYARSYGWAGISAVWVPVVFVVCIVLLWALVHVGIFLAS